jgi:uncharacterized protein
MSQRGAAVIDSREFARRQERLNGRLRLSEFSRLEDVLFDADGWLDYEISGEMVGSNAFLNLKLDGLLRLVCQRCLGAFEFPLDVCSRVMVVEPGAPWPDDVQVGGLADDTCDAIEASRSLEIILLLEEEILLALPISPRHEKCRMSEAVSHSGGISPFAQLARLKGK